MTPEERARQLALKHWWKWGRLTLMYLEGLEDGRKQEREACAMIADEYGHKWTDSVAQAIRARVNK